MILYTYFPTGYYGIPTELVEGGPDWIHTALWNIDAKAEDTSRTTEAQLKQMLQGLLRDRFGLRFHYRKKDLSGYSLRVGKNGIKVAPSTQQVNPGIFQSRSSFVGRNASMRLLARMLSNKLQVPVIDDTQLKAGYDFDLPVTNVDFGLSPSNGTGPSIFQVLQEVLGLRLESQKVPIEVVVIDSVAKPQVD